MKGLQDKVVLVTGAGGAIGRAISMRFAEEAAVVGVLDKDRDGYADSNSSVLPCPGHSVPPGCGGAGSAIQPSLISLHPTEF